MNIFSCKWQLLDAPVPYSAPSARLWAQQTCGPACISNHVYPPSTAKINLSTCWPISLWKHTNVAHTSLAHGSLSVFVPGSGIGPSKAIWKFDRVLSVITRKKEPQLIVEKMNTWELSSCHGQEYLTQSLSPVRYFSLMTYSKLFAWYLNLKNLTCFYTQRPCFLYGFRHVQTAVYWLLASRIAMNTVQYKNIKLLKLLRTVFIILISLWNSTT